MDASAFWCRSATHLELSSPRTLNDVLTIDGQTVLYECFDQVVVTRTCFFADRLNPCRIVKMGIGWNWGSGNIQFLDTEEFLLLSCHGLPKLFFHGSYQQNIRALCCHLKLGAHFFFQHRWGKWSEAFPILDLQVHRALHLLVAWVANDGASSQCSWAELHGPVKPADYVASLQ